MHARGCISKPNSGLTYTEIAKKYDVALSTVGKYVQQAERLL